MSQHGVITQGGTVPDFDDESQGEWSITPSDSDLSGSDTSLPTSSPSRHRASKSREPEPKTSSSGSDDAKNNTEPALLHEFILAFVRGDAGKIPAALSHFPFTNVAGAICARASLIEKLSPSEPNEKTFILKVPFDIYHWPFLASLLDSLAASLPEARLTGILAGDASRQHTFTTHILAQLCYQLLVESSHIRSHSSIPSDLSDDLRSALQGCNSDVTQTVLWVALRWLLTEGPDQQCIIVLGVSEYDSLSIDDLSVITNLKTFISSTQRRLKLLIVRPHSKSENIEETDPNEVFIETEEMKPALLSDVESWIDRVVDSRPSLHEVRPQISSLLTRHYEAHQDSLLPVAYLSTLCVRPQLSRRQLDIDGELLLGPGRFTWFKSIIAPIRSHIPHEATYTSAQVMLSLVRVSARPLTTMELAAALAVVHSAADSASTAEYVPLDIQYDLRVCLAGLVHEQGGYLQPSHPILGHSLCNGLLDRELTSAIPTTRTETHMEMAVVCLRYMDYWVKSNPGAELGHDNTSTSKWPFLNYAVNFWRWHYTQAVSQGSQNPDIDPFIENWDLVKFWITMWSRIHHLAIEKTVSDLKDGTLLHPVVLSTTFNVSLPAALWVAPDAAQVLSIAMNDEELAILWTLWCSETGGEDGDSRSAQRDSWKDKLTIPSRLPILLKLFQHAPLETFELLMCDPRFVADNTKLLLPTAIRQGVSSVVSHCLDLPNTDDALILELPWISCVRNGNAALLEKLALKWPAEASRKRNELGSNLLCEAVKYGNLGTVDILLGCDFDLDDDVTYSTDAILVGAKKGFIEVLKRVKTKRPGLFRGQGGHAEALYTACSMGFFEVAEILSTGLEIPPPIVLRNGHGDTPLHVAIQSNHMDVLRLLLEVRKSVLSQPLPSELEPASASPGSSDLMQNDPLLTLDGNDETPLQLAAKHENPDILPLLLDEGPSPSPDLSNLLHIAAKFGRSEVVHDLLKREGLDANAAVERTNCTALHLASSGGHIGVVMELLNHAIDVWAEDREHETALSMATRAGYGNVVKVLLTKSPDPRHLNVALHEATRRGDVTIMEQLLNAGANKNHSARFSTRTLLHRAAYSGQDDAVHVLLMRQANIDPEDSYGDTPLADACGRGHVEAARMLVDAGASLTRTNSDDHTPFQQAAMNDKSAVVRLLLERGFPLQLELPGGINLVEHLVHMGRAKTIEVILDHAEPDELTPALLRRCARVAFRGDDTRILPLLLRRHGVDLDAESSKNGFGTALQECAYHGNLRMAKVLMTHQPGVDVNKKQGRYHTALIASVCRQEKPGKAQYKRRLKMIKFLLEHDADPTTRGGWYGTILNAAAACASRDLFRFLLDSVGLPARWIDGEGRGPGHMACISSWEPTEKLEEVKKETRTMLRRPDKQDRRPLHFACGRGHLPVIKVLTRLLSMRWYVRSTDMDGWTPLHWACRQWNLEVVEFLVANLKADTTIKTADGWTAWDVAVFHGHEDFAAVLGVNKAEMEGARESEVPANEGEQMAGEESPATNDRQPKQEAFASDRKSVEDGGKGENPSEEKTEPNEETSSSEESPGNKKRPTKPGVRHDKVCFSCFIQIVGDLWTCDSCEDFHLCFKCQRHLGKEIDHFSSSPSHNFTRVGDMDE